MGITIRSDINIPKILQALFNDRVKLYANNRLRAFCDPYVPMYTGALSGNVGFDDKVKTSAECVHYMMPYAARQYTGVNFNFSTEQHQLATSYWDKAMAVSKGDELAKDIENAMRSGRI